MQSLPSIEVLGVSLNHFFSDISTSVIASIVLSVAWLVLSIVMWRSHRLKNYSVPLNNTSILIAYASQTGNAQAIAERCAQALNISESSNVIALNTLTIEHFRGIEKILFVVSTYGDGEAPDNGSLFIKLFTKLFKKLSKKETFTKHNVSQNESILSHVDYSVIALGDSTYPEFCAFGYQINQMMLTLGAKPLGDVITVDNYDEQTTKLASITPQWIKIDHELTLNPKVKALQYWQLTQRELLNPGCNDEKLLQLSFKSIGPWPNWRAGDLIDIQPQHPAKFVEQWLVKHNFDGSTWLTHQGHQQSLIAWLLTRELPTPCLYSLDELLNKLPYLHKRSYSVASISSLGQLQLIVRLLEKDLAKHFGLASGYLSHYCQIGSIVEGQIRDVSSHHNIDHTKPIILIGAGSGLAGLKAQIAARSFPDRQFQFNQQQLNNAQLNDTQLNDAQLNNIQDHKKIGASWLIFGERNSNPQLPINQQLATLQRTQVTKLNCAFSQRILKQDLDAHQKNELKDYTINKQSPKYVQDILYNEQDTVKQWVSDGAIIYVCGCLSGMGEGVNQVLIDILGQAALEQLQLQQRYIRDVY